MNNSSNPTPPSAGTSKRTEGKVGNMAKIDRIPMILEALQQADQAGLGVPEHIGIFDIESANLALTRASMLKDPEQLFDTFWFEEEIGCLFADSNAGKSILAVQIAEDIAKKQRVLYFDFELTDKQFEERYMDKDKNHYHFPDILFRVSINPDKLCGLSIPFEEAVMAFIEETAVKSDTKVLIIDNITSLCMRMEKSEDASMLVRKLRELRAKYGFSILILAHTPKRNMSNPITQNDLAGSKKLFNFIDSCFAIGYSAQGANIRYVIQLKVRNCEKKHGPDNVRVYSVEKVGLKLSFVYQKTSPESVHLRMRVREEQDEEVLHLSQEGKSTREIASMTGMSKSAVHRIIHGATRKETGVPSGKTRQDGQTGQLELFPQSPTPQVSQMSQVPQASQVSQVPQVSQTPHTSQVSRSPGGTGQEIGKEVSNGPGEQL